MGIPGKQSKRGEGEKESDKSVRDSLLKVKLPRWKLEKVKQIAWIEKVSLTDLINKIIGNFLSKYAEDITQKSEDRNKE